MLIKSSKLRPPIAVSVSCGRRVISKSDRAPGHAELQSTLSRLRPVLLSSDCSFQVAARRHAHVPMERDVTKSCRRRLGAAHRDRIFRISGSACGRCGMSKGGLRRSPFDGNHDCSGTASQATLQGPTACKHIRR